MSRGRERKRETPHAETHIFSIRRTRKSASTIATQCMRCWRPLNRFKFARVCRRNSQIELFFFFDGGPWNSWQTIERQRQTTHIRTVIFCDRWHLLSDADESKIGYQHFICFNEFICGSAGTTKWNAKLKVSNRTNDKVVWPHNRRTHEEYFIEFIHE